MSAPHIRYGYADTPLGQLHYAEAAGAEPEEGVPLLLLHQTPRSADEFREVQPLLAAGRRVIAMDMYGFGMSAKPEGTPTIEQYADGVVALADALALDRFALLGHHTGAFVAVEVAARIPARLAAVILSAGVFGDAAYRTAVLGEDLSGGHGEEDVDVAEVEEDGGHLSVLWAKRLPFYPAGRPDLLDRFIRDALAPGVAPADGHIACARYVMEERVVAVSAPLLFLAATDDPFSYGGTEAFAAAFPNAPDRRVADIAGGMIPLMEQKPEEVAAAVTGFLADLRV